MIKLSVISLLLQLNSFAGIQKTTADSSFYGFRYFSFKYQSDTVHVLIKSKPGEENTKKPLFLFCQGSLPQPLIKFYEGQPFGTFPFNTDPFLKDYHLVIIGKPGGTY